MSNEINSPTLTASTGDTFSSTDSHSESGDSQANYVRPMQRTSNGQMVPVNSDSVRSQSSQRLRPNLLTRDNRSRTPKRSDASSTAVVVTTRPQRPKNAPSDSLLRLGPSSQPEAPKNATVMTSSYFPSTDTLNSSLDGRHKPFSCCRTM